MTAILVHYVVEYRRMTHQLKKQSMENDTFFDSQNCIAIFKKLANLYDHEFRSISAGAGEQYVYDSHLRSYVSREQEWSMIKKEIGTIENQTFQII